MRKFFICTMLVLMTTSSYSQQTNPSQPLTRQDNLTKSKSQKTSAWILLGTGATIIAIAAPGKVSFDILPVLAVGGTASVLGSIPLFIAAGRNKRKAMNASTHFQMLQNFIPGNMGLTLRTRPTLSLKLDF